MHIVVVGFNHQSAPVGVREQVSFAGPAVAAVHEELRQQTGVHEVTVLSTCNRTEVYTVSICPLAGEAAARSLLTRAAPYLYAHRGRAAIEHLFRVASGIDSIVLGESEILGQVRRAAEAARELGVSKRVLTMLFQQAVQAGKRARTETRISHHAVSTAGAAVALARAHGGELGGKTVLLIGTGEIASQSADAMRNDAVGRLIIASRSAARASNLAVNLSGKFSTIEAVTFEQLDSSIDQADIVIAGTSCSEPVVTSIASRSKPLVVVDLGVPRNISIGNAVGVEYFDIDALNQLVESNLGERRREVGPVERIIAAEADLFESWLRGLGVQPIIATLHGRAEEIRIAELERALRRLSGLSEDDRNVIEALTQSIVNKLLHHPTIRLKEHASEGRGYQFAEALRDLFKLEQTP